MTYTSITEEKKALRQEIRQKQQALSPAERAESDRLLFARFLDLPEVQRAQTLLVFRGMGAEPDTEPLIQSLLRQGKTVALPRCLAQFAMEARQVSLDTALVRHPYGMLEPGADQPLVPKAELQLILVPGLAFDRAGGRLGQGGGYYDRYLAGFTGCTVSLCREGFLLDRAPRSDFDLGVALVVTEHGLYGPSAPVTAQSGAR